MSGIEIVGLVLGAFPIAITALGKYREISKRLELFNKIRPQYMRFEDEEKINHLLSDSSNTCWEDKNIAELLRRQLGDDSYQLVLGCIEGIKDAVQKLNHELALDSATVQNSLNVTGVRVPQVSPGDSTPTAFMRFQLYKVKFSNGESFRTELFHKLEQYETQLGRILDIRSNEANIGQKASPKCTLTSDLALCSFWEHANTFSKALASAWASCCQGQHIARLLLQHRTSKSPEFNMLFARDLTSHWHIQKTMITDSDKSTPNKCTAEIPNIATTLVYRPKHKSNIPLKSAMKKAGTSKPRHATTQIPLLPIARVDSPHPISKLCSSLDEEGDGCCGYLVEEESRYYVHRVSRKAAKQFDFITLDQIIRMQVSPAASRRKRYALSFTLASSFLQLLDTPWLPELWRKSDIIFIHSDKEADIFLLDQPYLTREFVAQPLQGNEQGKTSLSAPTGARGIGSGASRSIELLGVALLELCFGQSLESQPHRGKWPPGNNDMEKCTFDTVAARDWVEEVNEEAGPDFDEAIRWCLGGYMNIAPDEWRREMLRRVVRPLERCHRYLTGE
ncbi:uncharacterized protein F4822DRAFT_445662 [Hypoxylon trugodes]|uniref:uncharacterized protein n=1 Tax=Hypoxylon trugodes TaxID=326681 RepID=UPI00219751F7|nr:uncharacterized protein F4822DRAFT_445662 [Hypoxylon trugodes]KAI1385761.1 hypothetical protein F4822DRAFT_445662 [Hypoxylon trugodes]